MLWGPRSNRIIRNLHSKSSYTNSYPQRWDFTFWVKICSTTIILPHPWEYLQTSTLKILWGPVSNPISYYLPEV